MPVKPTSTNRRVENLLKDAHRATVANVYLGIDYGSKRIGLSHADELGLAFPLPAATAETVEARCEQIGREIQRLKVNQLILGYPLSLEGEPTQRCREVDAFAEKLKSLFHLPVTLVDEGLTSQAADDLGSRKPRSAHERKQQAKSGERDSRAATILLQDFLNQNGIGQL